MKTFSKLNIFFWNIIIKNDWNIIIKNDQDVKEKGLCAAKEI